MKKKVLIVFVLVLTVLVLFVLAGTVVLCGSSCGSHEYGLPCFIRMERLDFKEEAPEEMPEGGMPIRGFDEAQFESLGFAFYLIVPMAVGFWAGRKWPHKIEQERP